MHNGSLLLNAEQGVSLLGSANHGWQVLLAASHEQPKEVQQSSDDGPEQLALETLVSPGMYL